MTYAARRKRHALKNARKMKTRNEISTARLRTSAIRVIGFALMALFVVFVFGFLVTTAFGDTPDQTARWRAARLDPKRSIELDKAVALYQRTATRYQAVASSGVPAVVVFCLHYREASNSFSCSLAQGDPLTHRSIHIPRNRIPGKEPPYTWEECALDALALDGMGDKNWRNVNGALNATEGYNGWGYWKRGLVSPYNFAGTDQYARGKFTGDGRFDSKAADRQLGVAAILLRMKDRGIALPF